MIEGTIDLVVWWTLRATLLLGVVGLAAFGPRRRAASLRHALWVSAIAGCLALPALASVFPGWGVLPSSQDPLASVGSQTPVLPQTMVSMPQVEGARDFCVPASGSTRWSGWPRRGYAARANAPAMTR